MDPTPKKISANVPMNSATSFCGLLYMRAPPRQADTSGSIAVGSVQRSVILRERVESSQTSGGLFSPAGAGGGGRWTIRTRELSFPCQKVEEGGSARAGAHWDVERGQPVVPVRLRTGEKCEKLLLQRLGDGAAGTFADLNAVDRAQGADFGGGACEENFVGDVEHFARDHLLADLDLQVFT